VDGLDDSGTSVEFQVGWVVSVFFGAAADEVEIKEDIAA
jgi:hypothetical protein